MNQVSISYNEITLEAKTITWYSNGDENNKFIQSLNLQYHKSKMTEVSSNEWELELEPESYLFIDENGDLDATDVIGKLWVK
jgi:hypothetical protein